MELVVVLVENKRSDAGKWSKMGSHPSLPYIPTPSARSLDLNHFKLFHVTVNEWQSAPCCVG